MSKISRPEYINIGLKIYLEKGKPALLEYLQKNIPKSHIESNDNTMYLEIFCPSCGKNFSHSINNTGKITGGISGIATGAYFGAQIGIAGGPLGAIAGTIPGAILGGLWGKNFGNNFDKPICPNCKTSFDMPKNAKVIKQVNNFQLGTDVFLIADYIIFLSEKQIASEKIIKQKMAEARERRKKNIK